MGIYGYLENGILYTKEFEDKRVPVGYKPVEQFDHNKTIVEDGFVIEVVPYDACDKIAYKYEKRFDKKKVKAEITALKETLSEGDYRVIKCYEASLARKPLPYNIDDIYTERQKIRDKINELELVLSNA